MGNMRTPCINVQLDWLEPRQSDPRHVDAVTSLLEAARVVDSSAVGPVSRQHLLTLIQHGWDGEPVRTGMVWSQRGRLAAVVQMSLPCREDRQAAYFLVTVDPELRRRGVGRATVAAAETEVRSAGRTLCLTEDYTRPDAPHLLSSLGYREVHPQILRRQNLVIGDVEALHRVQNDVLLAGRSYQVIVLRGPVPEDMLADVVNVTAAINDAPTDDAAVEDRGHSAERLRAWEQGMESSGYRIYRVLASHRDSGAWAGQTVVTVDALHPWAATQHDTSVLSEHRGHRLGLRLKLAMLRALAADEPQLRTLETWNAASNQQVAALNALLGYQDITTASGWQKTL